MNLEFVGGPLDGKCDYATPADQREFHLAIWVPERMQVGKVAEATSAGPCRRIVHRYQLGGFCRCTPDKYDHEPVWRYEGCWAE